MKGKANVIGFIFVWICMASNALAVDHGKGWTAEAEASIGLVLRGDLSCVAAGEAEGSATASGKFTATVEVELLGGKTNILDSEPLPEGSKWKVTISVGQGFKLAGTIMGGAGAAGNNLCAGETSDMGLTVSVARWEDFPADGLTIKEIKLAAIPVARELARTVMVEEINNQKEKIQAGVLAAIEAAEDITSSGPIAQAVDKTKVAACKACLWTLKMATRLPTGPIGPFFP